MNTVNAELIPSEIPVSYEVFDKNQQSFVGTILQNFPEIRITSKFIHYNANSILFSLIVM